MTARLSLGKEPLNHSAQTTLANRRPTLNSRSRRSGQLSLGSGYQGQGAQRQPKVTTVGHQHRLSKPSGRKEGLSARGKSRGHPIARRVSGEGQTVQRPSVTHSKGSRTPRKTKKAYPAGNGQWRGTKKPYRHWDDWEIPRIRHTTGAAVLSSAQPVLSTATIFPVEYGDRAAQLVTPTQAVVSVQGTPGPGIPTDEPETQPDVITTSDQGPVQESDQPIEGTTTKSVIGFRRLQALAAPPHCYKLEHVKCEGLKSSGASSCDSKRWEGHCTHNGMSCAVVVESVNSVPYESVICGNCQVVYADGQLRFTDLAEAIVSFFPVNNDCPASDPPWYTYPENIAHLVVGGGLVVSVARDLPLYGLWGLLLCLPTLPGKTKVYL